jgi:putative sterol carrier protein
VAIAWRLKTPAGPRTYRVIIDNRSCTAESVPDRAAATVTFSAHIATFLRLISGQSNGLTAAASGDLDIQGDQTVALAHQSWFDFDQQKAVPKIASARDLARLIEGRSNAEINFGIAAIGVDVALEQLFRGLVDRFVPENGPRKRTVAQFEIKTIDGPRVYHLAAHRRTINYYRGASREPDFSLAAELVDLLHVGVGRLDALKAFAQGKLKIKGNLLIAATFPGWFDFS